MKPMMLFYGEFRKKLDSGNRLVIPSQLLKPLDDNPQLVCYIHIKEKCIRFYKRQEFEEMIENILDNMDKDRRPTFRRHFYQNSYVVELDNRKRFAIPRKFLEKTGIHSEVVIIGLGTRFEVWDADIYDEVMSISDDIPNIIAPF